MPVMDPTPTIRQVDLALPSATVNLLVLWRYELRWRRRRSVEKGGS
jgi:hypothetical protein